MGQREDTEKANGQEDGAMKITGPLDVGLQVVGTQSSHQFWLSQSYQWESLA